MNQTVVYQIDESGTIQFVNQEYRKFANAQGRPDIANPVGQSLWDNITIPELVLVYKAALQNVLRTENPITLNCRCDSVLFNRDLKIEISLATSLANPLSSKWLYQFSCSSIETRKKGIHLFPVENGVCTMCSWCNKLRVLNEWKELEEMGTGSDLFMGTLNAHITHGLCPVCYTHLQEEISLLRAG
ncbi:MAG: hypothetical protein SGI71_07935 [Verrucomicrobiota bacterium]|nr:hypothetical protein [Verrucomicrobiota bacterium]